MTVSTSTTGTSAEPTTSASSSDGTTAAATPRRLALLDAAPAAPRLLPFRTCPP
ncbi:hypothetical protein [Nannocystis pusilla]|uniref:hypothetical protein n=1 Tax=Nannocystis pusilla TaxID=889268 RepID=UPI003BF2091C